MGIFKELDPEVVRRALEGQVDILTPMLKKEEAFFRNSACPECRSANHEPFVNAAKPFTEGVALPNRLLRCLECKTEFDPYSRLITKAATAESD